MLDQTENSNVFSTPSVRIMTDLEGEKWIMHCQTDPGCRTCSSCPRRGVFAAPSAEGLHHAECCSMAICVENSPLRRLNERRHGA